MNINRTLITDKAMMSTQGTGHDQFIYETFDNKINSFLSAYLLNVKCNLCMLF